MDNNSTGSQYFSSRRSPPFGRGYYPHSRQSRVCRPTFIQRAFHSYLAVAQWEIPRPSYIVWNSLGRLDRLPAKYGRVRDR